MQALLSAVLGPLFAAIVNAVSEWAKLGWLRSDAARDERLRHEAAALKVAADTVTKVAEAKDALDAERPPDKGSADWWAKGAGVVVFFVVLAGCTTYVPAPITLAPAVVAVPRPALPGLTDPQRAWLNALVTAYEDNCVTVAVLGGQAPKDAAARCAVK